MLKQNFSLFSVLFIFFLLAVASCDDSSSSTSEENSLNDDSNVLTENEQEVSNDSAVTDDNDSSNSSDEEISNPDTDIDYTEDNDWDSADVTVITFKGDSVDVQGSGVTVNGTVVKINSEGTYSISGTLNDGNVIVDTEDKNIVRLIFNGLDITSSTTAPFYVKSAEKAVIVLSDGTTNTITDASSYVYESSEEDEPNAAVHSKADLLIYGNGVLTVKANYNDGITSKDGLTFGGGTFNITAKDDGLRGKDFLVIENGSFTVNAQGDGLKSDNEDDTSLGYISIQKGFFKIISGSDGIQAETSLTIADGDFEIISGGGNTGTVASDASAKGLKGLTSIIVDGGTFIIDSADDAVHSNADIKVNSGTFTISTGDDGIHSDTSLEINGGKIDITKSYEGIESSIITINDGEIHLKSSDDGINVAGGNDGSGTNPGPGGPGGPGGNDGFNSSGDYFLYINGGYIYVDAAGDGLDANGSIEMTGGTVIVNGPTDNGNGALDYDAAFNVSGGFLIAAGSSGMAMAPSNSSTQYSVLVKLKSNQQSSSLFHIETSSGDNIITFSPSKQYGSVAFTSPSLKKGASYNVYLGGSSTGTITDGLYDGGSYTQGSKYSSFTVSGMVTNVQ